MSCMKCGRETDGDASFCSGCRELMLKAPVRQDVVVQLPNRSEAAARRSRKKQISDKELLAIRTAQLRKMRRRFTAVLLLLLVVLGAVGYYLFTDTKPQLGRNYSTVVVTEPTLPAGSELTEITSPG